MSESTSEGGVTRAKVAEHVSETVEKRARWACYLSLVALGFIGWSLISQKPLPVIFAMTIGQLLGTLSLLLFLGSIALDVRARYKIKRTDLMPSSLPPSKQKD
ncbi:MAG: hypothetical protein IPK82_19270 [Polyangiaceae bacterium]|nr:hypothetical protein [Polyangiaceae bacterium]